MGKIFKKKKNYFGFDFITKVIEKKNKFILILKINDISLYLFKFSKRWGDSIFIPLTTNFNLLTNLTKYSII